MEVLQCVIGLPEVVGEREDAFQLPFFEHEGIAPVGFLIGVRSGKKPGGAFEEPSR